MKKLLMYKSSHIAYYIFGSGEETVFCFHGYGLTGAIFSVLQPVIEENYILICIDFPFHGVTDWKEGFSFSEEDLWEIMSLINPKPNAPFSMMGYSMGGRIALHLLQTHPKVITQVALIAPDGLKFNWWREVATNTKIGIRIFSYTIFHPRWLFVLIKTASMLHLINKHLEKFSLEHISDLQKRQSLYSRWIALRAFKPRLKVLHKVINQYKIFVNLLFGAYDKVITTHQGLAFKKNEPFITVSEIQCGHQLLKDKYATEVASLLRNSKV